MFPLRLFSPASRRANAFPFTSLCFGSASACQSAAGAPLLPPLLALPHFRREREREREEEEETPKKRRKTGKRGEREERQANALKLIILFKVLGARR